MKKFVTVVGILNGASAMPCSSVSVYIFNGVDSNCAMSDYSEEQTAQVQPYFNNNVLEEFNDCKKDDGAGETQSSSISCSEEGYTETVYKTADCSGQGESKLVKWDQCTTNTMQETSIPQSLIMNSTASYTPTPPAPTSATALTNFGVVLSVAMALTSAVF